MGCSCDLIRAEQIETECAKNDPKDEKVADVNRMGGERTSTMSSSKREKQNR